MDAPQIKGSAIQAALALVEREGHWEKLLENLSPPHRALFSGPILASSWYPVDAWLHLLDKLTHTLPGHPADNADRIGRLIIKDGLRRVYRAFLKRGSPDWVITHSPGLWRGYFQNSEFTILEAVPGRASVSISDRHRTTSLFCRSHLGGMKEAMETAGAQNLEIQHTHCRCAGADTCIFEATWSV